MKTQAEIYKTLKSEISTCRLKYILLDSLYLAVEKIDDEMPTLLQSPKGQAMFADSIKKLMSEQCLMPVGKKPFTHNGLHKKYKILRAIEQKDDLRTEIIRYIDLPSAVNYYIRHPEEFLNDKHTIKTINDFIKSGAHELATINERAYELFNDEKFFKGDERSRGETILKRLGLNYSDIGCKESPEPFFSFCRRDFFTKAARNICIIENKDTFWSFKASVLDADSSFSIDMVIYGEGRKILSSFRFIEEMDVDVSKDEFYYFGDIDPEGINIYCELRDKYYEYNILPLCMAYEAVVEIGREHGFAKTPKMQRISENNINRFTHFFSEPYSTDIKALLDGGFYIPQEALSFAKLKERFGIGQND